MYLNCKSFFSFRYGTLPTEKLVKTGAEMGASALALTNINNTCDAWDFYECCLREGIHPVLGTEIRNGDILCYLLLAKNNKGFREINRFLSTCLQGEQAFPAEPGLPEDVWTIYPHGSKLPETLNENERIGVLPSSAAVLYGVPPSLREKYVIMQPVTHTGSKADHNLHRVLRAIDKNTLLSRQQPSEYAGPDEYFISPETIINSFSEYPMLVDNTLALLHSCRVEMDFRTDKTKKTFTGSREDDKTLLEKLALEGLLFRYGEDAVAEERVRKELSIIHELGFNAYFLITWDIVKYAREKGFYYVGRGSGANSIVAYCLQISDVDPIELDLYFERFLNPYRTSPPDFDMDFSWADRDEVIAYVFQKYGKDHVALLGMYSTFQRDATIRELAKVYGLTREETDMLVALPEEKETAQSDRLYRQLFYFSRQMRDFPNYISIHCGGILISEEPLYTYLATTLPPKGFPTSQADMFLAEKINLCKLDVLSQRGLGHIRETLQLVKQNKQVQVNIHEVEKFKKDPQLKKALREVHTIGCFYIESPAMRQLLLKLRCSDYLTLVAASSIIRPGVAQSGMMRQYVYYYHHPDRVKYLHPVMKELLEETFGVMVYQEDVIKVAHYFAGLDLGEADILRRAMSGKYRGNKEIQRIRDAFFANCEKRNYDPALSAEIWRQIESFGGYSFSKAHSASYAVESYQSLFLKTYYPKEFMVAVINNFGGFYSRELYFYELGKTGVSIHLPCVNNSDQYTNIKGNDVYMGWVHLKSLENNVVEKITEERSRYGCFLHLQDFIERTGCPAAQLNILIRIDAFRFTGKNKKQLLWEANFLRKRYDRHVPAGKSLFEDKEAEFRLPTLTCHPEDDLMDEIELLGFPLHNPFRLMDKNIPGRSNASSGYTAARHIQQHIGEKVTILGYLITQKPVRTIKGERMCFGTFIDKHLDWVDTVHFPDSLKQFPLKGTGFYEITGKVVEEFEVCSIEVERMEKKGIRAYA